MLITLFSKYYECDDMQHRVKCPFVMRFFVFLLGTCVEIFTWCMVLGAGEDPGGAGGREKEGGRERGKARGEKRGRERKRRGKEEAGGGKRRERVRKREREVGKERGRERRGGKRKDEEGRGGTRRGKGPFVDASSQGSC